MFLGVSIEGRQELISIATSEALIIVSFEEPGCTLKPVISNSTLQALKFCKLDLTLGIAIQSISKIQHQTA